MNNPLYAGSIYWFTVILAMGLKIAPLPEALQEWNPDWVLLILMYWVLVLPYKFGVISAWLIGILTDVLTGRTLGQYALIYSLITYICLKLHKRVRTFPLLQQGFFIFCCLLLAETFVFAFESINNPARFHWSFLLPVMSGTFIWPFTGMVLRMVRLNQRDH